MFCLAHLIHLTGLPKVFSFLLLNLGYPAYEIPGFVGTSEYSITVIGFCQVVKLTTRGPSAYTVVIVNTLFSTSCCSEVRQPSQKWNRAASFMTKQGTTARSASDMTQTYLYLGEAPLAKEQSSQILEGTFTHVLQPSRDDYQASNSRGITSINRQYFQHCRKGVL